MLSQARGCATLFDKPILVLEKTHILYILIEKRNKETVHHSEVFNKWSKPPPHTHTHTHTHSWAFAVDVKSTLCTSVGSVHFGVSDKHIYWCIAICCLSLWHAAFDTWCSFTSHWDVERRCDQSRCCKSIWCLQTHCPVPVDTLPKLGISVRQAVFWAATRVVTEAGCAHQGRAFAQSLSNFQSHCTDHPRTASYQ